MAAAASVALLGCAHPNPEEQHYQDAARIEPPAEGEARANKLVLHASDLVRTIPPSQDAAPHYLKAFSLLEGAGIDKAAGSASTLELKNAPELRALLSKAAPALAEIEAACKAPHCDLKRDFGKGFGLTFPELPKFELSSRLLCARAYMNAASGDYASAGADIGRVGQMIKHLVEQPTISDALTCVAMESNASESIQRIVSDAHGRQECAKAMLAGMARFPVVLDPRAMVPQEIVMAYETIKPSTLFDKGDEAITSKSDGKRTVKDVVASVHNIDQSLALAAWKTRAIKYYVGLLTAGAGETLSVHGLNERFDNITDMEMAADHTHDLNRIFNANDKDAWNAMLKYDAVSEVTLLGLAHLATPEAVDLAGIASRPDPFTDKPLQAATKPGGFVLYSVGEDGDDPKPGSKLPPNAISFEYPYAPGGK